VFTHGKEFMSYTNPVNPGDPTLVQLTNGNDPDGALKTKPILDFGDKGLNLETGKMEVIPQNDPDSLKLAPNGDLLFASGADQTIIDVHNPGTAHQSVSFTQVQGVPAAAGLDDVLKVDASAGTFYLSDTADNRVLTVHATDLNPNDYYASVGNAFGEVDPHTGQFTALVSAANAPGFKFGSAHGVEFVADHNSEQIAHHGDSNLVSVDTVKDGFVFANGAGNTAFDHVVPQANSLGDKASQLAADLSHAAQSGFDFQHDASPVHLPGFDIHDFHLV
jgi:hypothetical protein